MRVSCACSQTNTSTQKDKVAIDPRATDCAESGMFCTLQMTQRLSAECTVAVSSRREIDSVRVQTLKLGRSNIVKWWGRYG